MNCWLRLQKHKWTEAYFIDPLPEWVPPYFAAKAMHCLVCGKILASSLTHSLWHAQRGDK